MVKRKIHRVADGYKKKNQLYTVYKRFLSALRTHWTKSEGMEKIFQADGKQKKAETAIPVSFKIDLESKTVIRDKEGYYIMIK